METYSPIILFVYNRPNHTKRTVESLLNNTLASQSDLFIFSDGFKSDVDWSDIKQVRAYIKTIRGFNKIEIIEREKKLGLANSVISGVSEILNVYDDVIVLEDDIISSPYYLKYMNDLIRLLKYDKRIFSISGYTFPIKIPQTYSLPVYLSPRSSSWGWGTWKDRWIKADWEVKGFHDFISDKSRVKKFNEGGNDLSRMLKNSISGKIDSWSVRWTFTHFLHKAYCVYPVKSLIKNIGADSSGVHTKKTSKYEVDLNLNEVELIIDKNLNPNNELLLNFKKFFKKNFISSTIDKFKELLTV